VGRTTPWSPRRSCAVVAGRSGARAAALHREFGGSPVVDARRARRDLWHDGQSAALPQPARARARYDGRGRRRSTARSRRASHTGFRCRRSSARAARAGALACTALGATARLASRREWEGRARRVR
jgi:hypothetical protein